MIFFSEINYLLPEYLSRKFNKSILWGTDDQL